MSYLIKTLLSPNSRFLIHIDKKSLFKKDYKTSLPKKNKIEYLIPGFINWGDWTFVKAMLRGMNRALKKPFDYLMFLTETDILLYNIKVLVEFLEHNNGKEFIQYFGKMPVHKWHNCQMRDFSPIAGLELYGGSSFWCLTRNCIQYLVDYTNNNIEKLKEFNSKIGIIPDEMFFHSILASSPFKDSFKDTLMLSFNKSNGCFNPKRSVCSITESTNPLEIYQKYPYKFFGRKITNVPRSFILKMKELIKK